MIVRGLKYTNGGSNSFLDRFQCSSFTLVRFRFAPAVFHDCYEFFLPVRLSISDLTFSRLVSCFELAIEAGTFISLCFCLHDKLGSWTIPNRLSSQHSSCSPLCIIVIKSSIKILSMEFWKHWKGEKKSKSRSILRMLPK